MINSKYFRVPKKKEPLQENEVHVTSRQEPINFLRYAIFLFEKRNLPYVKFKASGSAIASLVNIAEILKKVIPGIHQVNRIYTLNFEQDYEPKEKGLDHVKIVRNVPVLEISFYKVLLDDNVVTHYGYQPAISQEVFERVKINVGSLIRRQTNFEPQYGYNDNRSYHSNNYRGEYKLGFRGGRGQRGGRFTPGFRGRSRGGSYRGNNYQGNYYNDYNYQGNYYNYYNYQGNNHNDNYNYQDDYYQDDYYQDTQQQYQQPYPGRGRGFGRYHSKFDNVEQKDNINTPSDSNTQQ